MQYKKLDQLDSASSLANANLLPIKQGSAALRKMTLEQLVDFIADALVANAPRFLWYTAEEGETNALLLDGSVTLYQDGIALSSELSDLTDYNVTAVNRGNMTELEPTQDLPGDNQFNWAGETPTLTFQINKDLEPGEKLKLTVIKK